MNKLKSSCAVALVALLAGVTPARAALVDFQTTDYFANSGIAYSEGQGSLAGDSTTTIEYSVTGATFGTTAGAYADTFIFGTTNNYDQIATAGGGTYGPPFVAENNHSVGPSNVSATININGQIVDFTFVNPTTSLAYIDAVISTKGGDPTTSISGFDIISEAPLVATTLPAALPLFGFGLLGLIGYSRYRNAK